MVEAQIGLSGAALDGGCIHRTETRVFRVPEERDPWTARPCGWSLDTFRWSPLRTRVREMAMMAASMDAQFVRGEVRIIVVHVDSTCPR